VADKRQVVRLLLQRVVVWAPASSQAVKVQLRWTGGTVTDHQVRRPVRAWSPLTDLAALRQRVRQRQAAGWPSRRIAAELNALGHRTPRGQPFTAASVRQLRRRAEPETTNARRGRR
jgi:hypothetical protein